MNGGPASIGVIFDMDGVLVDSYAAHLESWRRLSAEIGASITEDQFASTFGQTSRDIIARLFAAHDETHAARLDDRKESIYRDLIRGRVPAMPGAQAAVVRLHAAGFKLAVGSSGPAQNVALVCGEMGLLDHFSAIVTGADVRRGKPDPEVFRLAARRLGLPPTRCIVVEDAPAGLEAARRASMPAIALVGSYTHESLGAACWVIDHLDEIQPEQMLRMANIQ